ncbi:hypothetical protein [Streptomyces antibioticus]|uniref:hypothetical protein n=1 Tax=Streptomyces antibioticus TaxID=1890 RepID=UPI0036DD3F35
MSIRPGGSWRFSATVPAPLGLYLRRSGRDMVDELHHIARPLDAVSVVCPAVEAVLA